MMSLTLFEKVQILGPTICTNSTKIWELARIFEKCEKL